jgi:hypothetical protein
MLQILAFTHKNIIATRANDLLAYNDYEKIHPLLHNIVRTGKKVRWYFEMEDRSGAEPPGLREDSNVGFNHKGLSFKYAADIDKIAIVGTKGWESWMRSLMAPFTNASVMYFDLTDRNRGMEWIMNQEEA